MVLAAAGLGLAAGLRSAMPPPPGPAAWIPPDATAAAVVFLDRRSTAATALWMRTVDRYAAGAIDPDGIAAAVRAIGALDPGWAEPWFFGVLMLPGDPASEDRVAPLRTALLERAATLHPEVPWFAFRAGMHRLRDPADRDAALAWLERAAAAPGADPSYQDALDAIRGGPR